MIHLLVEPSPSPTDVSIDPTQAGSPGFLGFVFTFLVAIAAVFLFLSLTKQMRRVDRRAKQLGLDEEEGDPFDGGPHLDVGLIDAGAAGPDSEVDADVPVVFDDPDGEQPRPSR
ncbi:hypothetical protein [Cellulomonas sp. URHE0023]|uniref:hypothetical protein n=1 Tax=Cellulomonas sp. URHE0023 TaxID=1380354 RepID=UPI00055106A5|nr:hypothetical protein [Cellulomonas sp. URHE0023]